MLDTKQLTVYVAGGMTGYENHNFASFAFAQKELEERGFKVITPFEFHTDGVIPSEQDNEYFVSQEAALFDLESVVRSDAVYMLRGWELSRGARAEHAVASWLGKKIWYE